MAKNTNTQKNKNTTATKPKTVNEKTSTVVKKVDKVKSIKQDAHTVSDPPKGSCIQIISRW